MVCAGILSSTGVLVLSYLSCNKNDVDVLLQKMGFSGKEMEIICFLD